MTVPTPPFGIGSFSRAGGPRFLGLVRDERVFPLSQLLPSRFGDGQTLLDLLQDWDASFAALAAVASAARLSAEGTPLCDLAVHAPLPRPGQVFCTGANYRTHVIEMVVANGHSPHTDGMSAEERKTYATGLVERMVEGDPYVFMKPNTSVVGPTDPLALPVFSDRADWELELGVVIGKPTYRLSADEALACVAGYMVVNDVTARDKVRRTDAAALGPDWISSKGSPGFLPTGPWLVPAAFVPNPQALRLRLEVNGVAMQDDSTTDMMFSVARQVAFLSQHASLLPGDLLCTGSPGGNGIVRGIFLKPGDVMAASIEGLGTQRTPCVAPVR
jgi:2-keto-4-pentenoate hydratase/2-oxohepta-3-ene-1,7-dioic acid hydratase in catechol pathway